MMRRLPDVPKTFLEMVEADLRRAARLIIKVQDELDPQLRVASPSGDWALAVSLPADAAGRGEVWAALSTFMVWKDARAFTLASEIVTPDALTCVGISAAERHFAMVRITRAPRPWNEANFGPVEWLPSSAIDTAIIDLLPRGPRALLPKEVSAMARWFGRDGKFPAVNMATGEVGA